MARFGTFGICILFLLSALTASMPITGALDLQDEGPDIQGAVQSALARVSRMREAGWSGFPPIDATPFIMEYLDGSAPLQEPTRINPIPGSWDLKKSTAHADIYVAQGEFVPQSDIDAMGSTFESKIYGNVTDWFHPVGPPSKISARIYDFGDGPGGTGGFFMPSYVTRNDLYIDSQDLRYSQEWSFEIFAHEFQHLLQYDLDPNEDLWLNEGLADLAIRVSLGPGTWGVQSHIDTYEQLPENDLLNWNEGGDMGTIADYGRAYAFMSYLADHYGGKPLIQDIATDSRNSLESIDRALEGNGHTDTHLDAVYKEKVANLLDDPVYGGGIYDQGLIDIGITTYKDEVDRYPYSGTIPSTVRYSGYYYKLTKGDARLGLMVNSSEAVHVAMVGTLGPTIRWSSNMSGPGSSPLFIQLSEFGDVYDTLYVIPSFTILGATAEVKVQVMDLSPPNTTVVVDPPQPDGLNGFYLTAPTIYLTTREGSTIYYSWNDDPFTPTTGSIIPPEGTNFLRFYSYGPMGLKEQERTLLFKLDTVDPSTNYRISPEVPDGNNGYYITQPTVVLSPLDPQDAIYYDLGVGAMQYMEPIDLGDGTWSLTFWGEDEAGRTEAKRTRDIKVDLSEPIVTLSSSPAEPNGKGGYFLVQPTIQLDGSEGAEVYYSLSGDPYVKYTGPIKLKDGIWELRYYAQTSSGKKGRIEEETFKVDSTLPIVEAEFDPPLVSGWNSMQVVMSLNVDDPSAQAYFMLGSEGPFTYTSPVLLTDGVYDITYWAVDIAGNEDRGNGIEVMVDITPPVTSMVFDREPDNGIWFYDDPPGIFFEPSIPPISEERTYIAVGASEFQEFTGQRISLKPGSNTIRFYSVDEAGNTEEVRSRDIGFDREAPMAGVRTNRTLVPVRGPVRFDMSSSTDDISVYRFRILFGDGSDSGWTYKETLVHDYTDLGTYTAVVQVEDTSGRKSVKDAQVVIEVLTQKEYDERTKGGLDISWTAVGLTLVLSLAVAAAAVWVLLLIRRHRMNELQEFEVEEPWG